MPSIRDITGVVFGRLVAIKLDATKSNERRKYWVCSCSCGAETSVALGNLTAGSVKSCGCLRKEILDKSTHGMYKFDPGLYGVWHKMLERCLKAESSTYANYGGRGVKVCDRWLSIENFIQDMYPRTEGTTLGRIDNDGNYEPSNCRWENVEQQSNNKRTTRLLTHNGRTQSMSQWAREINVPVETLFARLKNKTVESALTMKATGRKGNRLSSEGLED